MGIDLHERLWSMDSAMLNAVNITCFCFFLARLISIISTEDCCFQWEYRAKYIYSTDGLFKCHFIILNQWFPLDTVALSVSHLLCLWLSHHEDWCNSEDGFGPVGCAAVSPGPGREHLHISTVTDSHERSRALYLPTIEDEELCSETRCPLF